MRVLITGAAGRIGSVLSRSLAQDHFDLRLIDVRSADLGGAGLCEPCDVTDLAALREHVEGVDAIVHLAGHPNSRNWDVVTRLNIIGTRNVLIAAAEAGVQRVLYASSIHVAGLARADAPFDAALKLCPDSPYGVSKAVGESLLQYFAARHGLVGVALRICSFRPEPTNARELRTWLSPPDAVRLVTAALRADIDGFLPVWGLSNNTRAKVDRSNWDAIGYRPQDDAENFRDVLASRGVNVELASEWPHLGGSFVDHSAAVLKHARPAHEADKGVIPSDKL